MNIKNSKSDEQVKIPSGILGTLLTFLGGRATGRSTQDLLHTLREYRAPSIPHKGGFQPGDIILYGTPGDRYAHLDREVLGHPFRHHARVVIPDPKTGKPITVAPTDLGGTVFPQPGLKAVIKHLKRKGIKGIPDLLNKWRVAEEATARFASEPFQEDMFINKLTGRTGPRKLMRTLPGGYDVFRPKVPLTDAELTKLFENLRQTSNKSFIPTVDVKTTGIKSLFTPIINRIRGQGQPTTCAGGVCNVYSGIRPMPSASSTFPADLAKNKSFTHVMRRFTGANTALSRKEILKSMMRGVGLRAGVGAGLLAPGLFLLNRSLPKSPKQNVNTETT